MLMIDGKFIVLPNLKRFEDIIFQDGLINYMESVLTNMEKKGK